MTFISYFIKSLFNSFVHFLVRVVVFLERRKEGEREGEKCNVWLPLECPLLGTWPATQAGALTGNWTSDPWFTVLCSIHWATPARAFFINVFRSYYTFEIGLLCDIWVRNIFHFKVCLISSLMVSFVEYRFCILIQCSLKCRYKGFYVFMFHLRDLCLC